MSIFARAMEIESISTKAFYSSVTAARRIRAYGLATAGSAIDIGEVFGPSRLSSRVRRRILPNQIQLTASLRQAPIDAT
jgi:hypothetical protein